MQNYILDEKQLYSKCCRCFISCFGELSLLNEANLEDINLKANTIPCQNIHNN